MRFLLLTSILVLSYQQATYINNSTKLQQFNYEVDKIKDFYLSKMYYITNIEMANSKKNNHSNINVAYQGSLKQSQELYAEGCNPVQSHIKIENLVNYPSHGKVLSFLNQDSDNLFTYINDMVRVYTMDYKEYNQPNGPNKYLLESIHMVANFTIGHPVQQMIGYKYKHVNHLFLVTNDQITQVNYASKSVFQHAIVNSKIQTDCDQIYDILAIKSQYLLVLACGTKGVIVFDPQAKKIISQISSQQNHIMMNFTRLRMYEDKEIYIIDHQYGVYSFYYNEQATPEIKQILPHVNLKDFQINKFGFRYLLANFVHSKSFQTKEIDSEKSNHDFLYLNNFMSIRVGQNVNQIEWPLYFQYSPKAYFFQPDIYAIHVLNKIYDQSILIAIDNQMISFYQVEIVEGHVQCMNSQKSTTYFEVESQSILCKHDNNETLFYSSCNFQSEIIFKAQSVFVRSNNKYAIIVLAIGIPLILVLLAICVTLCYYYWRKSLDNFKQDNLNKKTLNDTPTQGYYNVGDNYEEQNQAQEKELIQNQQDNDEDEEEEEEKI